MIDHNEEHLQAQLKEVLEQGAQQLRDDPELQLRLAAARREALSGSSRKPISFIGWGGAVAASLLVAVIVLHPAGVDSETGLDPLLLELDSELMMDMENYALDADFYEWVADESRSAS